MKKRKSFILLVGIFISLGLILSCKFVNTLSEQPPIELSFDTNLSSIAIGAMDVINLKASENQNKISVTWEYDSSVINAQTDNYGAVITGLKPGKTTLKAICGPSSTTCLITVTEDSHVVTITNPYVYASTDYVELKPNETQKISASLFGGNSSDINGYTWSIDKPSVASLSTEGNYCWITGVNDGVAKITVKHNKAAYGFSVLVNCSSDGSLLTYITTQENIITINKSESDTTNFSVDLMNPLVDDYASGFTYKVVDELGKEINGSLIVSGAGSLTVSLTAHDVGDYYVRCSHPSAMYSLDVLVRVIENAETSYIEPSQTQVIVSGEEKQTVTLSLTNYTGIVDSNLFSWSFSDNCDRYISYEIYNGASETTGDTIIITGIKTGTCKLTVSYPGLPDRNIIVMVRDLVGESASAKTYITTSQNYMRMSVGDEENILITLTESKGSDINDLRWSIINNASDGSTDDVIEWIVGTGTSNSSSANSRSASTLVENANAHATIRAVNPGVAYIDISHPKAIYKTRITVNVTETSDSQAASSSLSLSGSPVVNIKNGQNQSISVYISGNGDESEIQWESSNNLVGIEYNGNVCVITAPPEGSGVTKATITARHKNSLYPVTYSVLCYDTQEELQDNVIRLMYSMDTDADILVNNTIQLYLNTEGFEQGHSISWSVTEGSELIDFTTLDNNKTVSVTGKAPGQAILKASSDGCNDVYFIINIQDENIIDSQEICYLSTYTNVVYFEKKGESQDLVISAFNISESSYSDIEFTCDSDYFEISSNGNRASITALEKDVKATLSVSHPLAENILVINLHCGEKYEYINEDYCYISTEKDTLELYAGQDPVQLFATLNHTEVDDDQGISKGFTFTSDNTDVVEVTYVTYSNYCYVEPKKNGTAKITITHPDSDFEKEVIVVVNHSPDITSIPYLSTKTNVITVVKGEYITATVDLKNSTSIDQSKWKWTSADSRTADVIANNGSSAMLSGNMPGTTEITVKHDECLYSLKMIVVVLDSSIISSRPYIKSSDDIITIKKGGTATITAQMIGSTSTSDNNYFRFNGSNSSIIMVNSASDSATIRGMNTGMAYVTISNSRYTDSYSKTVLVIVEDTQIDGVYIKPSTSIIKIRPDDNSLMKISAELVGGDPTDGENFIWWVDDPNILAITSVADQCSITPTGRSGTTKVHVKHEKALQVCDIIVMVSNYDTFAFSQTSMNISTEKLYFLPMKVPAIEDEYTIQYESSNDDICIVQGSNSVAWICGRDFGNASLTARMVNKEGVELSATEMLVSVTVPEQNLPVISLGNSIITMEVGSSKTFSAIISGDNVEETEKYNLKWTWMGQHQDGISILNENPDKSAYGADTYVTFHQPGEYVLTVTHEATGVFTSVYIIVEEKGEIGIELNSSLETIYKDEGSISLTATLINAAEKDYQNIEWSAVRVGGQAIVTVSKAKGKNCTVTPKNVGQTTVIAKLPSGKTATCVVIVKANAELTLELGSIHVIPGYTEVVNYTTSPENATINWLSQTATTGNIADAETYFTFEDDRVKKQLRITGLKDYPGAAVGTISGYVMGASTGNMTSLKVYVEYDAQLSLMDMNGNHLTRLNNDRPDTANVQQFQIKYYPIDLDIDICAGGKILACIPYDKNTLNHSADNSNALFTIGDTQKTIIKEDGVEKCVMTVSVVPRSEGSADISVKATLPNDTRGAYTKTENFLYTAYYDEYDIEIEWDSYTAVGAFTRYSTSVNDSSYMNGDKLNTLYIGDGEEAKFSIRIKNENAAGRILSDQTQWYPNDATNPQDRVKEMQLTSDSTIYNRTGSVTRLEKAKRIFGQGSDSTSVNTSAQEVATKKLNADVGVIHFGTEQSAGQTVFKLSHNWDFYKDLPNDVVGDNWKTYKDNNLYKEDFISTLEAKGVDAWMITKEMFTYFNQTIHYMTDHKGVPSNLVLRPTWTSGVRNTDEGNAFDYSEYWQGWHTLKATTLGGTSRDIYYGIRKRSGAGSFEKTFHQKYHTCIPYVMTTQDLKGNQFFVIPDNYDTVQYNSEHNGRTDHERDYLPSKKLLHDYAAPTVSKDTKKVKANGTGVLKIAYQQGVSDEVKYMPVNVEFERRDCEAYSNGSWKKETGSSGSTKWVLSDKLYEGTIGVVDPYIEFSTHSVKTKYGTRTRIDYEVYPKEITFEINKETSLGSLAISDMKAIPEVLFQSINDDEIFPSIIERYLNYEETLSFTSHRNIVDDKGRGSFILKSDGGYKGRLKIDVNTHELVTTNYIDVVSIPYNVISNINCDLGPTNMFSNGVVIHQLPWEWDRNSLNPTYSFDADIHLNIESPYLDLIDNVFFVKKDIIGEYNIEIEYNLTYDKRKKRVTLSGYCETLRYHFKSIPFSNNIYSVFELGSLSFSIGDELVKEIPIYLQEPIKDNNEDN